jgi:delta-aminolevulinic acid dehydratase/porphobilinogen synthase
MNKQQVGPEATSRHEQSSDVRPLAHAAEFSSHFERRLRNSLFSCRRARRRFGYLVDPRGRRSAAAEHAVDRLPEKFVRLR